MESCRKIMVALLEESGLILKKCQVYFNASFEKSMQSLTTFNCFSFSQMTVSCDSGSELVNGKCQLCSIGYYRNNTVPNQMSCSLCDPKYVTEKEGAVSSKQCTVGKLIFTEDYAESNSKAGRSIFLWESPECCLSHRQHLVLDNDWKRVKVQWAKYVFLILVFQLRLKNPVLTLRKNTKFSYQCDPTRVTWFIIQFV